MRTAPEPDEGLDVGEPSTPVAADQLVREVRDLENCQRGADTQRLIALMQQFDFKRSTTLVYSLLLADGPLSEPQLVVATHQSPARVDQALQQLLRLRLIGTDHRRGRRMYYATDPRLAWLALTADLVWGARTLLGPIRNLPDTDDPTVEHLRIICAEISALAQRLSRPHAAALMHKERDAESPEALAQLICEILSQARKHIVAVSRSPRLPQVSSFWAVLTQRLEQGVRYDRVVDLEEIIDHGLTIVSRDMEGYDIDLRVLAQARIRHKFYLVDQRFLAVFHQPEDPLSTVKRGVGRITTQPQIIARYRKRFRQYREIAMPGRFVLARMRAAADTLLEHARATLAPLEVAWLESLIEYGTFSRFHVEEGWSPARLRLAERRAMAAGLCHRNAEGHVVPRYPVDAAALEEAYTSPAPGSAPDRESFRGQVSTQAKE